MALPDVNREPAAAKQTKVYHPDLGIESIETAIEVKFVAEQGKAALAIGSIYENMLGYADSGFTQLVAVVFMTGAYLNQEMVDAELKKVGTPKSWRAVRLRCRNLSTLSL